MPLNDNVLYPEGYVEPAPAPLGDEDTRGRNFTTARSLIDLLVPVGGAPMRVKHIIDAICGTPLTKAEKDMRDAEIIVGTWLNAGSIAIKLTATPAPARVNNVRDRVVNREASLAVGIHEVVVGPDQCRSIDREEIRQLVVEEIESRRATWTPYEE